MRSRTDPVSTATAAGPDPESLRHKFVAFIAFSWGLCAYFPIGVMYLNLLLLLSAWAIAPDLRQALQRLRRKPVLLPLLLFVAWTFFAALVGDWYPDTPTRLFHTVRVALVLCLGMMLTVAQARHALAGFATGSIVAASIVALHHVWGMPDWTLWSSLLMTRNNFSSGNMITMATACGVCFVLALGRKPDRGTRLLLLAMTLVFGTVVAMHAISRNAQLLLAGLLLVGLGYRFRSVKAALGSLAAVAVLALAVWQLSPTTSKRFVEMVNDLHAVTTAQNYSSAVGVRWRMYEEATQGMLDQPVFGVGVGYWLPHWQAVWAELGPTQPPDVREGFSDINNPHNDFLLTGMETGVPGMLLLAWWLLVFVRAGWRGHPTWGGVTLVFTMSIIGTALVNAPLRDAALGMTLLWLLGASVALQGEAADA